jgi:hypothetical protein
MSVPQQILLILNQSCMHVEFFCYYLINRVAHFLFHMKYSCYDRYCYACWLVVEEEICLHLLKHHENVAEDKYPLHCTLISKEHQGVNITGK